MSYHIHHQHLQNNQDKKILLPPLPELPVLPPISANSSDKLPPIDAILGPSNHDPSQFQNQGQFGYQQRSLSSSNMMGSSIGSLGSLANSTSNLQSLNYGHPPRSAPAAFGAPDYYSSSQTVYHQPQNFQPQQYHQVQSYNQQFSSNLSSNPASPPKKKEVKRRTRTGCKTCRQRRIKCDERKPSCGNCEKSKKICLGYEEKQSRVTRKREVSVDFS